MCWCQASILTDPGVLPGSLTKLVLRADDFAEGDCPPFRCQAFAERRLPLLTALRQLALWDREPFSCQNLLSPVLPALFAAAGSLPYLRSLHLVCTCS